MSFRQGHVLYFDQGHYDEAEPFYLQALEIRERVLGDDHPRTAITVHNLGRLYRDSGRYAESKAFFERSLGVNQKAMGPDHPYVADDLIEYAKLLRKMGDDGAAAQLEARAKAIQGE